MSKAMSDQRPLISTRFVIEDDRLDPSALTKAVGLHPTEAGMKGDVRPGRIRPIPHTYWLIELKKEPLYSIDDGLKRLLDVIWEKRDLIINFIRSADYAASFCSNVTIYHDRPLYCLEPETIKRLAYFELEYCMDIFDYS